MPQGLRDFILGDIITKKDRVFSTNKIDLTTNKICLGNMFFLQLYCISWNNVWKSADKYYEWHKIIQLRPFFEGRKEGREREDEKGGGRVAKEKRGKHKSVRNNIPGLSALLFTRHFI